MSVLGPTVSLLIACALLPPPHRTSDMRHVRTLDAALTCALSRGYARSPTFRGLVDRLERSNVIVYLDRQLLGGRCEGQTQFMAAGAGYRYLRVTVETDVVNDRLIALLGHELRHAVEVADAPSVVDERSYASLYRRIGHGSAQCRRPGSCFDTNAAIASGYRVLDEVRHAPADPESGNVTR